MVAGFRRRILLPMGIIAGLGVLAGLIVFFFYWTRDVPVGDAVAGFMSFSWFKQFPLKYDLFMRLLFAAGAGGLVGIEREYHGRPAGMRTHILVSLGAAMVSVIAEQVSLAIPYAGDSIRLQVDPGRIVQGVVQGVVTGIGFLGAGAILKIGISARGLTTAASLWCMAIVGMGFGFGLYLVPSLGTLLILFALLILGLVEKKIRKHWYKTVAMRMVGSQEQIDQLAEIFGKQGWRVLDVKTRYTRSTRLMEVVFDLRLTGREEMARLMQVLMEIDYVDQFRIR